MMKIIFRLLTRERTTYNHPDFPEEQPLKVIWMNLEATGIGWANLLAIPFFWIFIDFFVILRYLSISQRLSIISKL